jgi:hypothetical protein
VGILADVFVSSEKDALEYESLLGWDLPIDRYVRIERTGFTGLEFEILWAVLEETEWDVDRHTLISLQHVGDTWLEQFPIELVVLLSEVGPDRHFDVASAWGASDELQRYGRDLEHTVEMLQYLAFNALSTERGMFLWGSM